MKYSIVIPTYNHCDDYLAPCIQSILNNSHISDIEIVISANGCTDNTFKYHSALKEKFNYFGLSDNLKLVWSPEPLGYPRAVNAGIKKATCEKILLLNNDAVILDSPKNYWLDVLAAPFDKSEMAGVSGTLKKYSPITGREFVIFFCAMIHRKVFDKIGLLDEQFGTGGNEDIDFCKRAETAGFTLHQEIPLTWSPEANIHVGQYPIYHKGEGTMYDGTLVKNWDDTFHTNELRLAKKHNINWFANAITTEPYNRLVNKL